MERIGCQRDGRDLCRSLRFAVKLEYNIANATGWYPVWVGLEKTGKWH
jgi:hypothetical protein